MIQPAYLQIGDTIGITAPSDGNKKEVDFCRLDHGKETLIKKGFSVIETKHVRHSEKGRSCDAKTRANEFMELIQNKEVKAIVSAKGGDYLCEMLSYLDWELIQANPKWIQGFSDNTGILFTITTLCEIATVYSNNFNDFGMASWHPSVNQNLEILMGKRNEQESFPMYEDGFFEKETGLEGYVLNKETNWIHAKSEQKIVLEGNLLGGCLDVLLNLVGTRFDQVPSFIKKQKETLWFLESYDLNSEALTRGLWQLKEAGWFEESVGFIFGRPCMFQSYTDTSYQEAVLSVLNELDVPIILDADIGHKAPQFTMINGKRATIESFQGKGRLYYSS